MNKVIDDVVFYKCVFVSIEVALIIWACVRLFADLLAIGYLGFFLLVFTGFGHGASHFFTELSIVHLMVLLEVFLIVDFGSIIGLIVGLVKRSYSILRVIFYYEIYAIAALVLLVPLTIYVIYAANPYIEEVAQYVCLVVIGILIVSVEVLVFLAVKSKLALLRNGNESVRIPCEEIYD